MARGKDLITSEYGKIISGAKQDYFEKLQSIVKSSENDKLWVAVKGGQAKTWSAPIKAYTDKGGPAIGFGSHFIPEGSFAKVNGAIKFGKATVDISWEITNSTSGKHQGTALE